MIKHLWLTATLFTLMQLCNFNQVHGQNLVLQLTPSNHNGYNVSCFGGTDGSINLTIYNGVAPFVIRWTNEATTEDIGNLAEGYYKVTVLDNANKFAEAEITLTQPEPFEGRVDINKYIYSNEYNTSCAFCNDGIITTGIEGGIPPYSFQWTDGAITQDRSGLSQGDYEIIVSDANGCTVSERAYINAPARDDWTMTGNTGNQPANSFLGTTEPYSLFFRTSNQERMSINSSGQLKLNTFIGSNNKFLRADPNGVIHVMSPSVPWETRGNDFIQNNVDFIGTLNPADLIFKTDVNGLGGERMRINKTGSIGIGTLNQIPYNNGSNNPCMLGINGWVAIGDVGFHGISTLTNSNTSLLVQGAVAFGTNTIPSNINFFVNGTTQINGTVGIDVDPTINNAGSYKLVVGGKIGAHEAWVSLGNPWPDYVFGDDHKILPIAELESFVEKNKHLPGMPSALEVNSAEKINLGEMQLKTLEKTEELYLYVIRLHNEVEMLRTKLELLENTNNE